MAKAAVRLPGLFSNVQSHKALYIMTHVKFLLLTLVLLIFAGCTKEKKQAIDKTAVTDTPVLVEAQAFVDALVAEMEADFKTPAAFPALINSRSAVNVPAGSKDALAAAVVEAGDNGLVVVEAGEHWESGTLNITRPVQIVGEDGAVIYFDLEPIGPDDSPYVPAIYVSNTSNVRIQGLEIQPMNGLTGYGVLTYKASNTWIADNTIVKFAGAVYMANSDGMRVYGNELTGAGQVGIGIGLTNGYNTKIRGNIVSGFLAGIFPTGKRGLAFGNEMFDNLFGYTLCQNDEWVLPDGTVTVADEPSNQWVAKANNAHDNQWGYLIIDGAFQNYLFDNYASKNSSYDIELAGPTFRFGGDTPLPTSKQTVVVSAGPDFGELVIKDCGQGDEVIGGKMVDTTQDACF